MAHEATARKRHDKTHFRRHLSTVLVLIIEFLKDFIKILNILVNGLGPALKLQIKRVELIVHPLHARNEAHHHLTLKTETALQISGINKAEILLLNLLETVVHRKVTSHRETLGLQALQLVDQFNLLLLLSIRVTARRQREDRSRGRL